MNHSALHLPALRDCRRLFLQNFRIDANIGIYDFEKRGAQRTLMNVDLYVPLAASTPQHDRIGEVFDYDFIRDTIRARIERGHINLLETLCDDVAATLLAHPLVRAVRVSSSKLDVYADCDGAGVEVFHIKDPTMEQAA